MLDKATCLVWQKTEGASTTNVQGAKQCDELVQDGCSDWRVPRPEERATWPELTSSSNAYITAPTYIPNSAASTEEVYERAVSGAQNAEMLGFQREATALRKTAGVLRRRIAN